MTPHTPTAGRDADIAVLQATQQAHGETMRELNKAVSEGFAAMNAKLDRVNEQSAHIAQMQAEQRGHTEGLQRAFAQINALQANSVKHEEHQAQWKHSVEQRLSTARGVVITIAAVFALVLGLIYWLLNPWFYMARENNSTLHKIQLELERNKTVKP